MDSGPCRQRHLDEAHQSPGRLDTHDMLPVFVIRFHSYKQTKACLPVDTLREPLRVLASGNRMGVKDGGGQGLQRGFLLHMCLLCLNFSIMGVYYL